MAVCDRAIRDDQRRDRHKPDREIGEPEFERSVTEDFVSHVLLVVPPDQSETDSVDWKVGKDKRKPELTRRVGRLREPINTEPHQTISEKRSGPGRRNKRQTI